VASNKLTAWAEAHPTRLAAVFLIAVCVLAGSECLGSGEKTKAGEKKGPDYLRIVKSYAHALIVRGRDRYGLEKSPLFATTLDRRRMTIFDEAGLERLWQERLQDWDNWRVRNRDRMTPGANPMHDQNLYQILYALTQITGEQRYAKEADRTIKWFFEHCQSPVTGLMAWGEHMGWDFRTETLIRWKKGEHHGGKMQEYNTHEFARPWVLWDRSFELAPQACEKFAVGLWEHQISDHNTGNFSRHANYEMHQTFTDSEYPRHGGFYIAAWAEAFERTRKPLFLKAIEMLVTYFDGRRSSQSDAIPAESAARSGGKVLWPASNLSLAIDVWEGAKKVPEKLAKKMRHSASRTDELFLKLDHDLGPNGKGFVGNSHVDTLVPNANGGRSSPWGHAGSANLCLVRYNQVKLEGYKKLALDTAGFYLTSEPPIEFALHPSSLGQIIYLMLGAHELTGERRYLKRADYYAERAVELFFDESSPLPKATSKHEHYEAVTRADTLMMAMLRLWATKNRPDLKLRLVYCDR
jgi:hypothetical protein